LAVLTKHGVLRFLISALAALVLVGTALPFIKTDEWWVRVFDFPRLQMAALGLILAIGIFVWRRFGGLARLWLAGALLLAVAVHVWQIFPYTPLSKKQVLAANAPGLGGSVLVANVQQKNRDSSRFIDLAESTRADLIIVCEADEWWTQALAVLESTHPHRILQPQTNTYGMNFYSRHPLHQPEVRFLIDRSVPSMRTWVEVDGKRILVYAVHPRPPGIKEPEVEDRVDSGQRDSELALIALEVQHVRAPVIVAGDFNDVAWSHTTRLFQRFSRLLDPRVGRGLYNSYHARYPFWRLPLDHLFHSDHFRLVELTRCGAIGSDHFPIFVHLRLQATAEQEQEAPPEKPSDKREAVETIKEEVNERN
jgi:endonuclease/exonuclease/phosphatase (EEP) superfamily protein YafD